MRGCFLLTTGVCLTTAGNERYYYKGYKASPNDNIMQQNQFNPYFIKSELLNF